MERRVFGAFGAICAVLVAMCGQGIAEESAKLEAFRKLAAEALSFPDAKLMAANGPLTENNGYERVVLHANVNLKSSDNSFYPLLVSVGWRGDIIPIEERKKLETALSEAAAGIRKTTIRRTETDDGAILYLGLGMAGPGGSAVSAYVDYPEANIAVRLIWQFPNQARVEIEKAPESYQQLFSSAPAEAQYLAVVRLLADGAVDLSKVSRASAVNKQTTENPGNPAAESGSPGTRQRNSPHSQRSSAEFPLIWPWLAGGLLLLAALVIALRRRT